MYDSPRTKVIKNVFDDQKNFEIFRDYCLEFEKKHNIQVKIFARQLLDYYNAFKKDIRDKFKKLAAVKKIKFESEDAQKKLSELFVQGINKYSEEFSYNRINPNQVHYVNILRKISEEIVGEISKSSEIIDFSGSEEDASSEAKSLAVS